MKVVSIVGARPQFVKAGPISRSLRRQHREILVHTGQHYDDNMSAVFFEELDLPRPDHDLGVGSGPHGAQTGAMLAALERVIVAEAPDWVIVYGDTNSTLAGALAGAKLRVPVAHVEAGLRSFNRAMPEEINRVVADHVSSLLFCPSETAVGHLRREGVTQGVHLVGDVMAEVLASARDRAERHSTVLDRFALEPGRYLVATVHRAENTDDGGRLQAILRALAATGEPVVFPVHPRTRARIAAMPPERVQPAGSRVQFSEPLGYLDLVRLVGASRLVLTDSGGLQKEAYWLGIPCLTLRDETEWVETVEAGWNLLVGADFERIVQAARSFSPPAARPPLYGDRSVADRCVRILESCGN